MSKYATLVFKYDSEDEFQSIRDIAQKEECIAWSLDHELHRIHLIEEANEKGRLDLLDFIFGLTDTTEYKTLDDMIAANDLAA
ncbi:MAG: hypothetical protein WC856_07975 [Methylococcaceae bacterium]|jgi:hypothetical protein